MSFVIVDNDIMGAGQGIDGRHDALVTEVEQIGGFFLLEVGQLMFEMLVHTGVPRHHTGTHGSGEAVFGGGFGIHTTNFRVVSQTQIVVQTPAEYLPAVEGHARSKFAFQTRECEITVSAFAVLPNRATGIL